MTDIEIANIKKFAVETAQRLQHVPYSQGLQNPAQPNLKKLLNDAEEIFIFLTTVEKA